MKTIEEVNNYIYGLLLHTEEMHRLLPLVMPEHAKAKIQCCKQILNFINGESDG